MLTISLGLLPIAPASWVLAEEEPAAKVAPPPPLPIAPPAVFATGMQTEPVSQTPMQGPTDLQPAGDWG